MAKPGYCADRRTRLSDAPGSDAPGCRRLRQPGSLTEAPSPPTGNARKKSSPERDPKGGAGCAGLDQTEDGVTGYPPEEQVPKGIG